MKHIEKIRELFVLCSIDKKGQTCYLRSLHEPGKWEIVTDIEIATKYTTLEAAEISYDFYKREMGNSYLEFVIIPMEIEYRLIQTD